MSKEIIILTIAMGNDGAERVLSELSREWIKQGHKVSIIQTGANNYGVSYDLEKRIEIINIHASSKIKPVRYCQEIKEVIKILKTRPNATLLSFLASSIFECGVASLFIGNKVVVSERNNPKECPAGKIQQKMRDWAFCHADVCVFQTDYAMKMFPWRAQQRGVIIPNPINGKLPAPFTGERKKEIITACRLHPQKNLTMMINAFAMLHEEHPEYVLKIFGQGNERGKLEQLIAEKGLSDAVFMPGFSSDIHNQMRDATMFVSSSDYEGISNSMLEALGMGVPTVVTDCPVGGAGMMIRDGVNGLLVPVGDTEAFYRAMKRVIEDKPLAEKLSKEAAKINDLYPVEVISQKWIEIL